jgi:hypothetical protein
MTNAKGKPTGYTLTCDARTMCVFMKLFGSSHPDGRTKRYGTTEKENIKARKVWELVMHQLIKDGNYDDEI